MKFANNKVRHAETMFYFSGRTTKKGGWGHKIKLFKNMNHCLGRGGGYPDLCGGLTIR